MNALSLLSVSETPSANEPKCENDQRKAAKPRRRDAMRRPTCSMFERPQPR